VIVRPGILLLPVALLAVQAQPRFRSGVDVVTVDVLVTDGARTVTGLAVDDFELRDSGVAQTIDTVTVATVPVSMLLALDTSNSVEGLTLTHLKEAASAAVHALARDDRAAVLTFADAVTLRAPWGAPSATTHDAIEGATAGGATSLYDAAYAALTLGDDQPGRRPLVVLFSDGGDTSSWLPARAVLERARRTDAVVYLVALRTPRFDTRLEYRSGIELWSGNGGFSTAAPPVVELATLTGGQVVVADRPERLRDAFAAAVTQFRTRYLITYRPQGGSSTGWHPIEVRLHAKRGTVTARRGYSR
jgi:Ca-activated chloride channel family protein